jgi:hypothetical protein
MKNGGSRNTEARSVWYFVSHIINPLSRHDSTKKTQEIEINFEKVVFTNLLKNRYGKLYSMCKIAKARTKGT